MKTETELNSMILKITMQIQEQYPELTKYLTEVPVKNSEPASDHIKVKELRDYYDSLCKIVTEYQKQHESK